MPIASPRRRFRRLALAAAVLLAAAIATFATRDHAQSNSYDKVSEIAATLASGQVTVIAGHDGFVVTSIGKPYEPGDPAPLIIPLSENDLVVALGAVDWVRPPANHSVLNLGSELPRLMIGVNGSAPRLSGNTNFSNLERIGLSVLGPLRKVSSDLHAQLHLPRNLPLAELILVRQPIQETGDLWDLNYWLRQTFLQEHFWQTEVERPRYTKMFPTKEKNSGLFELSYPPAEQSTGPVEWLTEPTGRLAQAIAANHKLAKAQRLVATGKATKVKLSQLVPLVKMAIEDQVSASTPKAMAAINWNNGFSWIIKPPPSPYTHKHATGRPTLGPQPHN
jgi:hypothetical protein